MPTLRIRNGLAGWNSIFNNDSTITCAGFPVPDGYPYPITILTNQGFVVGCCEKRQDPVWSCYRVFALAVPGSQERPSRFRVDGRTAARIGHDDYTRSGYDRGHMCELLLQEPPPSLPTLLEQTLIATQTAAVPPLP